MAIKPVYIQRRMMELGRVRLGHQVAYEQNGVTKYRAAKLSTLRFTSASKPLLEAIAAKHGGTVKTWVNAPDEGYYEVFTNATEIDIILPPVYSAVDGSPTASYSQFFELWSGGGCQRRCDGETEAISGKACMCDPDGRECKITTRVSFMLPDIPGLGVWRLESHGYNAAVELPGTLEVLLLAAAEQKFIHAVLRVEQRTKKVPGEGTRRFIVPVIDLPNVTVKQLVAGDVPSVINAPVEGKPSRPELPAAPAPANGAFRHDDVPGFGAPPALPGSGSVPAVGGVAVVPAGTDEPPASAAQKKKLNVLVGTLRDAGHITTEQLYRALDVNIDYALSMSKDGELHWSPLRESLTMQEASDLIERLSKLEQRVTA